LAVAAQPLAILAGMAYQGMQSVGFVRQAATVLEERKAEILAQVATVLAKRKAETLARIASFPVASAMKAAMTSLPVLLKNTRYSVVARAAATAGMTAPPAWLAGTLNPSAAARVVPAAGTTDLPG